MDCCFSGTIALMNFRAALLFSTTYSSINETARITLAGNTSLAAVSPNITGIKYKVPKVVINLNIKTLFKRFQFFVLFSHKLRLTFDTHFQNLGRHRNMDRALPGFCRDGFRSESVVLFRSLFHQEPVGIHFYNCFDPSRKYDQTCQNLPVKILLRIDRSNQCRIFWRLQSSVDRASYLSARHLFRLNLQKLFCGLFLISKYLQPKVICRYCPSKLLKSWSLHREFFVDFFEIIFKFFICFQKIIYCFTGMQHRSMIAFSNLRTNVCQR